MRLWSLHPSYLDTKALVACWREGLLARKVLMGETTGYRNHPQLERFKESPQPLVMIDTFLRGIFEEAQTRGYTFNREKIGSHFSETHLSVTHGQLDYEFSHLKKKLQSRDPAQFQKLMGIASPLPHPLFTVIDGDVEPWERA